MKVLIVFSAAGLGGAERSLSRMALGSSSQCEVEYILSTFGGEGAWAEWVREAGYQPFVMRLLESPLRVGELGRYVRFVRELAPAIIYVVGVRAATLVRLLKPLYWNVKIVHGIRTTFLPGTELAGKFRFPERLLQYWTDLYIANSILGAGSLSRLARIPPARFRVIPNGVDIPELAVVSLIDRPNEVAVIANLHPLKGHREFLKVMALVRRECPWVIFRLIGTDLLNGEIQRRAAEMGLSEAVRFEGFQANVWPVLISSRLFVLPSREVEGAPTSILEAQGAGLPVVAFDIGGVSELIQDGLDGYTITRGDDVAMADAIVSLLNDTALASRMGLAGREKVLSSFTLEKAVQQHVQVWHELSGLTRSKKPRSVGE